ncbi:Eco57I restriction-modification methylase domain-containing protein [uncultured Christiangramia sp.]|uniref:Eco57I restriction-modification methylase domain-containing protein n=1 Tax=uncultured Christiangramia sp. TaxID=503836 RepID=UPI002621600F|nr:Eco57I restriction-modification methylase domain-containing protein [uncultured Christiangramia sp.]
MMYGKRSNGIQHGLVLTKPFVVDVMLDRVGYTSDKNLKTLKVIEPAAGDGGFALSIIDRLYQSSLKHNFSFQEALNNLTFYEIDKEMSEKLKIRILQRLEEYSAFLPKNTIQISNFLTSDNKLCDLIIGNPPYVRHENIPEEQKEIYRKKYKTFTHRSDLYIAFYEKSLSVLNKNGVLSFICSNRWLKNQYGKNLRSLISLNYSIEEIIDLEKTSPFEEEVIAYPAITTIKNFQKNHTPNYFEIDKLSDLDELNKKVEPSNGINFKSSNWFSYNYTGEEFEKNLDSIENQGFKIGIGVATGSDKTFIRSDFESIIEEELLVPILKSKDLKQNSLKWSGNYILNPFSNDGGLINLEKYPKAKSYLYSNKDLLTKRHISKKNPKNWYKTIDRIKPELTKKCKILLPDISGNSHLFIDKGDFYPHHNLYYILGNTYDKLVVLAAILMSDFVKSQLIELGNKMNGGYPRWQSQNLKKLRIPIIDSIPKETKEEIILAYNERRYSRINQLINPDEISKFNISVGQMKLFETRSTYLLEKARHANNGSSPISGTVRK